jgi:DNA-binding MarR family transcriptional regulator
MDRDRRMEVREDITEALDLGAALLIRYVARGTSLTSRTALRTLQEDGPTRLTELAAAAGVSQPAMTQLVGRMEREGLVVRLIDPDDARATLIDITAAGQSLRAELHQAVRERMAELLDSLSPRDEATLGLAMHVALPLIEQLTSRAAEHPQAQPAPASLNTQTRRFRNVH